MRYMGGWSYTDLRSCPEGHVYRIIERMNEGSGNGDYAI